MAKFDWTWLVYGVIWLSVGFVLGYVAGRASNDLHVAMTKETKAEMGESQVVVTPFWRKVGEKVALFLVVVLTAWAAFQSQDAVDKVKDSQSEIQNQALIRARETNCISRVLFSTVQALNERTTYTEAQAQANVRLQSAQAKLISYFLNVPGDASLQDTQAAIGEYFTALTKFRQLSDQVAGKRQKYSFPTEQQFVSCLKKARTL